MNARRPIPLLLAALLTAAAAGPVSAQLEVSGETAGSYNPVYVADSLAAQEHIDESSRLLAEDRPLDAAAALQPVIETLADKLISLDDGSYTSAALWVERHIRASDALRQAYEQAFGPTAERLTSRAIGSLDESGLAEVFDRFGLTAAGREAGLALAAMRLESADPDAAQAVLHRLASLHGRAAMGPRYDLLAATAAFLRGDDAPLHAHRSALQQSGSHDALAQLDALEQHMQPLPPHDVADPRLPRAATPLWSFAFEQVAGSPIGDQAGRFRAAGPDGWLGVMPAVAPRDDGGRDVVINTGQGVVSIDQVSGWPRWTFTRTLDVKLDDLDAPMRLALQRGQPILDRRGALVLGDRVYAALGEAVYWTPRRQPELKMTELVCLDRETGRRLWQMDPDSLDPTLAQCFFVGTPVSDGQRVYVAARRHRSSGFLDSFVLALDPADGTLLWRRHLSSLATRQRTTQAPPVEMLLHGGRLYVHDYAATVAAVEPRSGRTAWLRVVASPTDVPTARRNLRAVRSGVDAISPLVLGGAGLIVPSVEASAAMLLLDPEDGRVLRSLEDEAWLDARVLAPAGHDVLAVGDRITLFDGATLEPIWSQPAGDTRPNTALGVPQVTGRHVVVSLTDGVRILDRASGAAVDTLTAGQPGNVLALDGQVLLATAQRVDSYLNWSDAYVELRRRADGAPDDPRPGVALAHLAMNAGETGAVLEGIDAALTALRLSTGTPRHQDLQSTVFDEVLALARPGGADARLTAVEDQDLRQQMYERLRTIATTPAQQIAYHFAAAALAERRQQWRVAVDHYQALLADRALASHMHRQDQLVQRTGEAARRRLERLVDQHGPVIYERYSETAAQQLAALGPAPADPSALIDLAERYPLAPASPRALVAAAERFAQSGDAREAARQLRRAYPRAEDPELVARISGALASSYEAQGLPHRAAQWLRRVARDHPTTQPMREGQPLPIESWLSLLAARDQAVAVNALPRLGPPLGGAVSVDGRLLWPVHADASPPPRDRFLVARDRTLAMHGTDGRAAPRWTQTLPAEDAAVLMMDEESVLLWSARDGRLFGLDATTGEPAFDPVNVAGELEQVGDPASRAAAMSPEQRRFMAMVDNEPLIRDPRQQAMGPRRNVFTAADESVVCMADDVGRIIGVDRWTGRILWRTMSMLDRATSVAMGGGVLAVAGIMGESTSAVGGGLLVLDAHTGERMFPMVEDRDPLTWLGVAPSGLIVAVTPRMVTAHHVETGEVAWRHQLPVPALIGQAWIDGSTLLAQGEGGAVEVIDLRAGRSIRRLPMSTSPRSVLPLAGEGPEAPRWLLLNNVGLTALDAEGNTRWRDAVSVELSPPLVQAVGADAVVMVHDDGERAWAWCFDPVSGRLLDERWYERGNTLREVRVLDGCLLIGYEDRVEVIEGGR